MVPAWRIWVTLKINYKAHVPCNEGTRPRVRRCGSLMFSSLFNKPLTTMEVDGTEGTATTGAGSADGVK